MKKSNFQSKNTEDINDKINEFSKMSESELKMKMQQYAKEEILNGSLDNSKLEDFYVKVSTFLSPNEQTKLKELIDSIKL